MKELKKSVKVIIIVSVIAVCVLALVLGLVFGLKDINKGGSNTPPPPSGPNTPVDPDNPDNPQNPDEPKATFTIYIDYNLPEGYEKAGEGLKTQDVGQKASTYELSKLLEGLNLSNYLEGWYYADGDSKITNGIVGPVDTNEVRVRAEWNIERIQKYYYSDGLGFDTISGREVAMVTEYKGTSPYVFLPEVFINKNMY